jgi:hypothetical protein
VKHVCYIRVRADGEVYGGPGQCDEFAFEHLKTLPGGADLIIVPPNSDVRIGDKVSRKTLKVLRKGPLPQPEPTAPTIEEQRSAAYPPLNEFAEAFTEKELGDDTKWRRYLKAVQKVKTRLPKP